MRLSRYLRVCDPDEAVFEQSIDVVNYYHDLEDRLEVLIAGLRPNQAVRRATLNRQLEVVTQLRKAWDRKRIRASRTWGRVLQERRQAI